MWTYSTHPSSQKKLSTFTAGVVLTIPYCLWRCTNRPTWFLLFGLFFFIILLSPWFTNMPPGSADRSTAGVLSALPLRPSAWKVWGCLCKHTLLWQRAREREKGGGGCEWLQTLQAIRQTRERHWAHSLCATGCVLLEHLLTLAQYWNSP